MIEIILHIKGRSLYLYYVTQRNTYNNFPGMNLDRLYAILHPLDYLGAVRQQLFKEKEKHTLNKLGPIM